MVAGSLPIVLPIALPIVAIVGRPNVGKSTLFNRLLRRRQAIVHDSPGVTRDRIRGVLDLEEEGRLELFDTGGLVLGDDPLGLNEQVLRAVAEADLLLLLVDGREGLTAADRAVWHELRKVGRPALLVVNKADTRAAQESVAEFYSLGIPEVVLVSSEHGIGIDRLIELILERVEVSHDAPLEKIPALAIVGRPNVGKSSLLNRLVGASRSLVSPQAGTTRDPVDTLLEREGGPLLVIDTAGIRRRSQVADVPEEIAVMMAKRQIERAEVAVLVVDAAAGVTSGDLAIAGAIWELGRAAVVAVNKWDLLGDDETRRDLEIGIARLQEVLHDAPRVNVSALSGRGVERVLPAVDTATTRFRLQVPTAELNRVLERAVAAHNAPSERGRPWNLLYSTQVSAGPPTFLLFANRQMPTRHTYRRYLENYLRGALDLAGVPLRLVIKKRSRDPAQAG